MEELVNNFIKHEKDFQELVEYFQSVIPSSCLEKYQISFELGEKTNYSTIILYSRIISSTSKNIGGINLKKGTSEYNSVLAKLNWNYETVKVLEKYLSTIRCDVIRTVDNYGGCKFEIYPTQDGNIFYSYNVFEKQLSDSLLKIHGKTISDSNFGKRVVLVYSVGLRFSQFLNCY